MPALLKELQCFQDPETCLYVNLGVTRTPRMDKRIPIEGGGVATRSETVLSRRDERKRWI